MDWYSWLSKSTLDPLLVYDYSFLFAANELEEDDIKHFNHEFLQSMGISIAKHRLEILKIANKSDSKPKYNSLFAAINKTKIYITEHVQFLLKRDDSAVTVVPRNSSMLKRNKKVQGSAPVLSPSPIRVSRSPSPMVYRSKGVRRQKKSEMCDEDIRWGFVLQDLKPN